MYKDPPDSAPRVRSIAEIADDADVHVSEALEFVRSLGIEAATSGVLLDHERAEKVAFELGLRTQARGMAATDELNPQEPIGAVQKRREEGIEERFGTPLVIGCDNAGRGFYFRLDVGPETDVQVVPRSLDGYPVVVTVTPAEEPEPEEDGPMTVRQMAVRAGLPADEVLAFVHRMGYENAELDAPVLKEGTVTMALYQLDMHTRARARLAVGDLAPTEPIQEVRERHNAWALREHGIQLYYGHNDQNEPYFLYLKLAATEAPAGLPDALDGYPLVVGLMKVLPSPPRPGGPFMPREARDRPPPGPND